MTARARRVLAAALLAALLGAAAARADYRETFRQGIVAVDNQDWPEVARLMRSAAAEQTKEGESVRIYGTRFLPYLPHFYLGLALFRQKDCEGALAQWKESEDQGAVKGTARWNALTHDRDVCAQSLAAKPPGEPPRPSGPDPAEAAKATQKAEAERQAKILADRQAEAQARDRNDRNDRKAAEERDKKAGEERERKAAEARERQRQEEEARKAAARKEAENRELAARQALEQEIGRAAGDARCPHPCRSEDKC